jgi:long-chain acyl-CoA synthetase
MLLERAVGFGSRTVFKFKNKSNSEYENISWHGLSEQVRSVSKALLTLGFGVEDNIGIFSDNKPQWTIADFGILGVRAVVVPFYATSSKQQLKYIVDETKMRLLFVGNREQLEKAIWLIDNTETIDKIVVFDSDITSDNEHCISWEAFCALGENEEVSTKFESVLNEVQPTDLATIIYTSGTTGEPKGVMLYHQQFFSSFRIHDIRLDVRETDVSACFLPLSHIFERTWTYYILSRGATVAYIDNPREIISQLPIIRPTVMCTVPRFFEKTYEGIQLELTKWPPVKQKIFKWSIKIGHLHSYFLSQNEKAPLSIRVKHKIANKLVLSKLRNIFGGNIRFMPCAGAAISPKLLRFFHATGLFVNYGYGATETLATVSCFKSEGYNFDTCGSIMPEVMVKISNDGEILIKGETVFTGYYNKSEETAKTLVDGWYKSGDEGYIAPNGDLVMTDRIKDLIKTSVGKYVSPQKVELVLGQDPFIEQVIAIGDNRKYITALIVPAFNLLKLEADKIGIKYNDPKELIAHNDILKFFAERLEAAQEEFTSYEKVVKFKLLPEPFSIQNGMLTNTLKVRRNALIEQFSTEIEAMYSA